MRAIIAALISAAFLFGCGGDKPASKLNENGVKVASAVLQDDFNTTLQGGNSGIPKEIMLQTYQIAGTVSSAQLSKAYSANEVSADEIYKGKNFVITGTVQSINKDITGSPYVVLNGKSMFENVHAQFKKDSASELTSLRKGQNVKMVCKVDNYIINTVTAKNCQNLDSYLKSKQGTVRTLASDIILGKKTIGSDFDKAVKGFYLFGKSLPADNSCIADIKTKECRDQINKFFSTDPEKIKAEIEALNPPAKK